MGISVIYFTNFQYNKAEEQRRVDPVVRTGPKSVLTLSRMVLERAGEDESWSLQRRSAGVVAVIQKTRANSFVFGTRSQFYFFS